jgi:threonine synthase
MDIQVSSNFERLLFELEGRDGRAVAERMAAFQQTGIHGIPDEAFAQLLKLFCATAVDDDATRAEIRDTYRRTGTVLDPHSAVGVRAARRSDIAREVPIVALACAHPAKFPDVVTEATGIHPALPAHLADLFERPERLVTLPNDLETVEAYIRSNARIAL